MNAAILSFTLTAIIIELTPGPNMATLVSLTLERGRQAGLAAVAGVALGLAIVGLVAAFGLAALISREPWLAQGLRWGGAAYLVYLGIEAWRGGEADGAPDPHLSLARLFRTGLILNLLNPKAALFYVAVLPGFVDVTRGNTLSQTLILAAIYVSIATLIHAALVLLAARLRPVLIDGVGEERVRRTLAVLMILIAIWFLWETR